MKSIHILISILVHIATALSGRSFGDSHHHAIHRRAAPSPRADGVCYTYTIQQGDNCAKLAGRYQITVGNIESWNTGAWDWRGCDNVKQGDFVCLSSGALPMPVALPRATCGPQVPGTKRPARYADLASLNPCPLDQCCAKSGQCGTTAASCDATKACIFNCGEKKANNPGTLESKTQSITSKASTKSTSVSKAQSTNSKVTTTSTTSIAPTKKVTTKKVTTKKVITSKATTSSTTKKKVTAAKTTTQAEPTGHWQMTLYENKECKGDYFSIQGYGLSDASSECFALSEDTNTEITDKTRSCRWWNDGGLSWSTCASSKLKEPKSWAITSGQCYVYMDKTCTTYVGMVAGRKCRNYTDSMLNPTTTWGSMRCWDI
ncbi:hypothetical protein N7475_000988 [Penicillium sp. IBT 31633x]|nr:hypothetical protein N7475_000988 [Penicillium sp. IBT 31633x]